MEENKFNNVENQEEELDLIELVKRMWGERRFIFKVVAIFALLGLFVALFSPKEYSAGCLLVPQMNKKGTSSSISSLAAMAGISLGDMTNSEIISPKIYDKVLNNANLKKELIHTPIKFEDFDEPVTILDYYTNPDYRKFSLLGAIKKYTIGLPFLLLDAIMPSDTNVVSADATNNSKIATFTYIEKKCLKRFENQYSISIQEKDGYITINANMPEPLAAAQVANRLYELLQKYVTEFKVLKAKDDYEFIKKRYQESKIDFENKQEAYAKFVDANKGLSTALSRTKEEIIRNEYTIANALHTELAKQMMQAEIKVKEDTPILTAVEPVVVPTEKSKPRRSIILAGYIFFGGILACGFIFGVDWLRGMGMELNWANKYIRPKEEQES